MVKTRNVLFIFILALPLAMVYPIALTYLDCYICSRIYSGGTVAALIVSSAPIILDDLTFVGELSPFFIATVLATLAPKSSERKFISLAVSVCFIGWISFVIFRVLIEPNRVLGIILATRLEGISPNSLSILSTFSDSFRLMYVIVAAGLVGVFIRNDEP
jgi:hypothetical protein